MAGAGPGSPGLGDGGTGQAPVAALGGWRVTEPTGRPGAAMHYVRTGDGTIRRVRLAGRDASYAVEVEGTGSVEVEAAVMDNGRLAYEIDGWRWSGPGRPTPRPIRRTSHERQRLFHVRAPDAPRPAPAFHRPRGAAPRRRLGDRRRHAPARAAADGRARLARHALPRALRRLGAGHPGQLLAEELGRSSYGGFAITVLVHTDMASPHLANAGSEEQLARYMPRIASGEILTAVAVTEPDAGSDVARLRTSARRDGGDRVINRSKMFITNGVNADLYFVAARTDPHAGGSRGITMFMVEKHTPASV